LIQILSANKKGRLSLPFSILPKSDYFEAAAEAAAAEADAEAFFEAEAEAEAEAFLAEAEAEAAAGAEAAAEADADALAKAAVANREATRAAMILDILVSFWLRSRFISNLNQ
jgi:hypothetical protein